VFSKIVEAIQKKENINSVLVSAEYGGAPALCSGVSPGGKASNILEFLNRKHFLLKFVEPYIKKLFYE
jgi:hypothetical protein